MRLSYLTLYPPFDGVEGWVWITELDCIDPDCKRFTKKSEDFTANDGTVFVYAYPIQGKHK
jgi:hypothetical protein